MRLRNYTLCPHEALQGLTLVCFYWYSSWKSQVMQFWLTDLTCHFICWNHKKGTINRSYGQQVKQRLKLYFTCVEVLNYSLQNFQLKISIDLRMCWKVGAFLVLDCPKTVWEKKIPRLITMKGISVWFCYLPSWLKACESSLILQKNR